MTKHDLAKRLAVVAFIAQFAMNAHAGFSISVKPMAKSVAAQSAPAMGVQTYPVGAPAGAPVAPAAAVVKLSVGKGESLQSATKAFLSQNGWTPAWMAGDVVAGDPMTFEGKDHEEALTAFLRHYNLVGERFVAEKGYVIRRNSESAGAN